MFVFAEGDQSESASPAPTASRQPKMAWRALDFGFSLQQRWCWAGLWAQDSACSQGCRVLHWPDMGIAPKPLCQSLATSSPTSIPAAGFGHSRSRERDGGTQQWTRERSPKQKPGR